MTIDTVTKKDSGSLRNGTTSSSLDTIFRAFSDPIRREIVVVLRGEDEPVSVTELAHRIDGETDRTRTALFHVHLPMLNSAGIVNWASTGNSVEFGDVPEKYDNLLASVEQDVRK